MMRHFFVISFILLTFIGCELEDVTLPFNFERDTPVWLKEKVYSMSIGQDYYGVKVFRFEWKSKYFYHIMIPISSCAYCELYDENGNKVNFTSDQMFQDFLINKKNEVLVWEWKK